MKDILEHNSTVQDLAFSLCSALRVCVCQVSLVQNLSRICSNGLFFRTALSQHFHGLHVGFRTLHRVQDPFRKLLRRWLFYMIHGMLYLHARHSTMSAGIK